VPFVLSGDGDYLLVIGISMKWMHAGGNCGSGIKESYLPFHGPRMILTLLPSIIYLQICHTQG